MKRIIALMSLVTVTGAFGQSTSQTSLKTKEKSFLQKINSSYYGYIRTKMLTTSDQESSSTKSTSMYNSLIVNYDHDTKNRFVLTVRHELTDANAGNGDGDRFIEADPRFAYRRELYSSDKITLFGGLMLEAPVSRYSNYSQGDKRIARGRLTTLLIATIDDYNQFLFWGGMQKTAYQTKSEKYSDDPFDVIYTWASWTNSALSEQYKFRIDLETATAHLDGAGDLEVKPVAGDERILAGVNFDALTINMYPYIWHDPSLVKATDKLGAGIQFFKAF